MFKVSRKAARPTLFDSIVAIYEVTSGFAPTFVCTPPQVASTCLVIIFILFMYSVMEQNTNGKLCVSFNTSLVCTKRTNHGAKNPGDLCVLNVILGLSPEIRINAFHI